MNSEIYKRFITKNKWYHKLYNRICYVILTRLKKKIYTSKDLPELIFLTGFFRSGTSLITAMLVDLGMDIGPKNHLLQAKGPRSILNPDGFYENYLFMDISLSLFSRSNSWGSCPPTLQHQSHLLIEDIPDNEFNYESLLLIYDDRISNRNKLNCLKHYGPSNIKDYVSENFKSPAIIKNPHFSVLPSVFLKSFPKAKFLCVFRFPDDAIKSTRAFIPNANYELYKLYYSQMLELPSDLVLFFSFDNFLIDMQGSMKLLAEHLKLEKDKIPKALSRFKKELIRNTGKVEKRKLDSEHTLYQVWNELNKRCINS